MLKVENKETLITKQGYTHDIINEISTCFGLYWKQCTEIAEQLKGNREYFTCRNIFNYITKRIIYVEDVGEQKIKTPARFLKDGEGDCKSFAIFIASCLRCLNIPASFRYVSFRDNKIPTHVYIVTKSGIIIDPVERVDGKPKFNYAGEYTYKIDIDIMQPTQISRLTGTDNKYRDLSNLYNLHIQSEPFIDNTIALNWINSEIELHITLLNAYKDEKEAIDILNYLDRLSVLKRLYKLASGNRNNLERLANVMQLLEDENVFNSDSLDDKIRSKNLTRLIDFAQGRYTSVEVPQRKGIMYDLVMNKVVEFDYNNVTEMQLNQLDEHIKNNPARVDGRIKEHERKEIENRFKQSGMYFSYAFLSSDFMKKNNIRKQYKQINLKRLMAKDMIKQFAKEVSSFTNEAGLNNLLLSGAIEQGNGLTPDRNIQICIDDKKQNIHKVNGLPVIIGIISGIISIIGMIIDILTKIFGRSSVTPANVKAAKIAEADFNPLDIDGKGNGSPTADKASLFGGKSLPLVAISAVFIGYLIFKNNSNVK